MKVEIVELTGENLNDAPEWGSHPFSCKWCLYWEEPELPVDPKRGKEEELFRKKLAWLKRVRNEFGECGKLLYVDQRAVGYAQYAPARLLPNAGSYPAGPASGDAVLISCLFIAQEEYRRRGLGSLLLEGILAELRGRGIAAVETFARRGGGENPSGPVGLYLKHGFHVFRNDEEFPLMRLVLK